MNTLPTITGSVTTNGLATLTVVQLAIPAGYFGILGIELVGQLAGAPATSYLYQTSILVSGEAGPVATIRDSSAVPTILDPASRAPVITVDTSGANVRVLATGFANEDWNWVALISGLEHSRLPEGTYAVYDPSVSGTVTPYQDFTYTGSNIIPPGSVSPGDGDCEDPGFAAWTTGSNATTSKQSGTRTGGTGIRVLQCLSNGAGGGSSSQNVVLTTARYAFSGWQISDGSASVCLACGGYIGGFSSSNVWNNRVQYNILPSNGSVGLWNISSSGFGQADDFVVVRVPITTQCDSTIIGGTALTQPGAAAIRPTYLNTTAALAQGITGACFQFDGAGQYFIGPTPTAACTQWMWVQRTANTATDGYVLGCYNSTGPRYSVLKFASGATPAWTSAIGGTITTSAKTSPLNKWQFIAIGWDGNTTARVMFDTVSTDITYTGVACTISPSYIGAANANGAVLAGTYCPIYTGVYGMATRLLSYAELLDIYNRTYRV